MRSEDVATVETPIHPVAQMLATIARRLSWADFEVFLEGIRQLRQEDRDDSYATSLRASPPSLIRSPTVSSRSPGPMNASRRA